MVLSLLQRVSECFIKVPVCVCVCADIVHLHVFCLCVHSVFYKSVHVMERA